MTVVPNTHGTASIKQHELSYWVEWENVGPLKLQIEVLREQHPDTLVGLVCLASMSNLADVLDSYGKHGKTKTIMQARQN